MALTLEHWIFYPVALLIAVSALGVVLARNPLHGALWLVVSFFFLSVVYLLLGAHLVAILQVIVYTGAIMVLFLFVIMLLALGEAELGAPRFTALKAAAALAAVLLVALALQVFGVLPGGADLGGPLAQLPAGFGTVAAVGRAMFRDALMQFEAISLLLLVAVVGAVVVARGRI